MFFMCSDYSRKFDSVPQIFMEPRLAKGTVTSAWSRKMSKTRELYLSWRRSAQWGRQNLRMNKNALARFKQ